MKLKQKTFIKTTGKTKTKFDNSDHPHNSKFHDETNKKVIGKFKVEARQLAQL